MSEPKNQKETPAALQSSAFTPEVLGVLKDLLREARTPIKSEEEIRKEQQRIEDRTALGEQVKAAEATRIANQEACTHMRRDGSTSATYITGMGFLYCQACGLVIKSDERPEMFNRILQLTQG